MRQPVFSYDDIEHGVGDAWVARGWRHATGQEVCALFAAYVGPFSPCPGSNVTFPNNATSALISFIGATIVNTSETSQTWALYDDEIAPDSVVGQAIRLIDTRVERALQLRRL